MLRFGRMTLGLLVLFGGALAVAAWAYPGGSWTDERALGFSLVRNYWCDLLRERAINGQPNPVARPLSRLAFAALGGSLFPYWRIAGANLRGWSRSVVGACGPVSALAVVCTMALPSDRFPVLHGLVALAGGVSGIACAALSVAAATGGGRGSWVRRGLGGVALALAAVNMGLYVHVVYGGGEETALTPVVQKLATLALVGWMWMTVQAAAKTASSLR